MNSSVPPHIRSFAERRAAFIETAEPGGRATHELSAMTDEAVRELAGAASSSPAGRWALFALGGWGAGALLPASDLDILFLSDASQAELKPFVSAVLYPLWDVDLKVGHQVRSLKGQLRAMREDVVTCTAALTARPLGGNTEWAARAIASWTGDAQRRAVKLLQELANRPRPGSPYLLEPDLKAGRGGRRDYDELAWRAILSGRADDSGIGALVEAGLLTVSELAILEDAAETIAMARWCLQRSGRGDRMDVDSADELSFDAELVQRALAATSLALDRVRSRSAKRRPGMRKPPSSRPNPPESGLTPLAALSPADVVRLLERGDGSLEESAQSGSLESLIPGFRELMTLRRPGLGHELTVGAHSIKTAEWVASPPPDLGRALAASWHAIEDRLPLIVAALAHDIGKSARTDDHPLAGAERARAAALRFGLNEEAADEVAALVRLHLVLPEIATTADLDDEDAMLAAAARVGNRHLIAPLHLLSAADSKATGEATWTPWLDNLLGILVARLDLALSPDVDGAGIAARAATVQHAVLGELDEAAVAESRFVRTAPLRYLASRDANHIASDARLVSSLLAAPAADEVRISVSPAALPGASVVTVVAGDRPQLFARLAGAISLAGLDILGADAYPLPGGLALDVFTVSSATTAPLEHATFVRLERFARAALHDRLELATRLAERRRHYPTRRRSAVRVETEPSGWGTTLRVRAPDRVGLLHDIAKAVADEGLDIRWAKALTVDGVAKDTFFVSAADGGAVTETGALGHLSMRVREAAAVR